jgi:hypothetical protein
MAGSRAMTILVDDLVPDERWALVEPLLPAPPDPRTAAGTGRCRIATCFAAVLLKSVFPTFGQLLLLALLMSMICGP